MNLSSDSDYTDSEDDEMNEGDNAAFSNIKYIEVTFEIFVRVFGVKLKMTNTMLQLFGVKLEVI